MALPLYLAMTAAEMAAISHFPPHTGYMACHFSPYGTGLCNLPKDIPPGGMLILNDRIPWHDHDGALILRQLEEQVSIHGCSCVLLDFQRPGCEEVKALAQSAISALPCPVAVSECYGDTLSCPVFLPPVPLDMPIKEYLQPWKEREIWLESALDAVQITLTESGSRAISLPYSGEPDTGHRERILHCRYRTEVTEDRAQFTLHRTRSDLDALLEEAEGCGVTRAVGLWQELSVP